MYYKTCYKSSIGNITLACDSNQSLIGLWFEGQKYFEAGIKDEIIPKNNLEIFEKTEDWLKRYFAGKKPETSEVPLAPVGNEFRQEVWQILCEIPYGKVVTYGDIAKKIAQKRGLTKMSAQAVGGAVGHNPISIIIPCHRVVGANGNLTGYAGGIDIKTKLLGLEGIKIEENFVIK